jgi:hypothetical protein
MIPSDGLQFTHRDLLRAVGGAGAVLLSGCSEEDSGDPETTDRTTGTSSDTATASDTTATGAIDDTDFTAKSIPELESIVTSATTAETPDHLQHYLQTRIEILRRLKRGMEADRSSKNAFYRKDATVQAHQLDVFKETLGEELRIDRRNRQASHSGSSRIDVTDLGAAGDGDADDEPALAEAVERARNDDSITQIYLPEGEYRLGSALYVEGLSDVEIRGEPGTRLVGAERGYVDTADGVTPMTLEVLDCHNVRFRNLAIDVDPLPFTQGTVDSVTPAERTMTVSMDEGFAPPTFEYAKTAPLPRVLVRDPESLALAPGVSDHLLVDSGNVHGKLNPDDDLQDFGVEALGGDRYRLTINHRGHREGAAENLRNVESGQGFVLLARGAGGHTVRLRQSAYTVFRDCAVHASFRYGFFLHVSNGSTKFVDSRVAPPEGSDRLQSTNADAINSREATVGPYLRNCTVLANGDDTLNVHPNLYAVESVESPTVLRVDERWVRNDETFETGDVVAVVSSAPAEILAVRRLAGVESTGEAFERPHPMDLTLEEPLEDAAVDAGDLVVNVHDLGAGYVVSNCTLEKNRAKTAQLYTTNGIIEETTFDDAINFKCNWSLEQGYPVRDVVARNNTVPNESWYNLAAPSGQRKLMRRIVEENSTIGRQGNP